ncbi:MAG: DUF2742 domain-containing protein [Mycolicibacterium sp.]|uniref:DUF2742 domain-containing protein n=1 Tax=Mycolicibacterium sp. TaxID=2320850 RepID=UPI000FAE3A5B|nr:DUF2742 domain-containing protein [Mycolicibacterium sp.]RUP28756.1 MAG: DUF2742 domain-containing protein [Mycolicibacterium sp.]
MTTNAGRRPFWAGFPASQQVSWWDVHQFVQALDLPPLPFPGTPAWQNLNDQDKTLACIAAAPHYALALDTRQEHLAEASKAIAAGENWAAVARTIHRRNSGIYIPRKAS